MAGHGKRCPCAGEYTSPWRADGSRDGELFRCTAAVFPLHAGIGNKVQAVTWTRIVTRSNFHSLDYNERAKRKETRPARRGRRVRRNHLSLFSDRRYIPGEKKKHNSFRFRSIIARFKCNVGVFFFCFPLFFSVVFASTFPYCFLAPCTSFEAFSRALYFYQVSTVIVVGD